MRILLLGISGTSRDILLAPFILKNCLLADPGVAGRVTVEAAQYKYLIPDHIRTDEAIDASRKISKGVEGIVSDVLAFAPDLLAVSLYTWSVEAVFLLLRSVAEKRPGLRVVLGGPELSAGDILAGRYDNLPIDFAIVGEGEEPFRRLVRGLLDADEQAVAQTPRLARRVGGRLTGPSLADPSTGLLESLDLLPSPYLTGAVPDALLATPGIQANIETQRGCNFRCAYCLYHAQFPSIRYRDARGVIDEILALHARGVRALRITDSNFLSDKERAKTILSACIEKNVRMQLFFEAIPSFIDEELSRLLRAFIALAPDNKIMVGIGLQSINPKSLKAIRRSIPRRAFDTAFDLLRDAGVIVKTDVILGLPFETRESWLELLEYLGERMRHGQNYLTLAVLRLLPGTDLETVARDNGLVFDLNDPEHFVHETPTLPREQMVECLRLSTVAFRLFCTEDREDRARMRDTYFAAVEALGQGHVPVLRHLSEAFSRALAGAASDYADPAFPNAEHYWFFDVFKEIPDSLLLDEFEALRRSASAAPAE